MRRLWGLERQVAEALERGNRGLLARALGGGWAWAAQRRARVSGPAGAWLIGVEGSTLGGSWKTPVSLALAEELARRGRSVGFLSHGHGARPGAPRQVAPTDAPGRVGDEAVLAARALAGMEVPVMVGRRSEALAALAARAGVIVADGLSVRAGGGASVLALDAGAPWGSGRCPPAGDLRAPAGHLLGQATEVVEVALDERERGSEGARRGWWRARAELAGQERARGGRVAVVTAVARPGRFVRALERGGVRAEVRVALPDHGGSGAHDEVAARLRGERFDAVVCTEKCALWLGEQVLGRPVVAVGVRVELPGGLVEALGGRSEGE